MKKRKPKINPFCPVRGCQTKALHANDPTVKGLIALFSSPTTMTEYVVAAMAELRESVCRDREDGRILAWHSRLRQPEELYFRTLHALFIAKPEELPHIFSGDPPNGISPIYAKVNEVIFQGRGALQKEFAGKSYGTFKPMDMLHDSAHVTLRSLMTCMGLVRNPSHLIAPEKYRKHLTTYCDYLNHLHQMFKAGRSKGDALAAIRQLHTPRP